VPEKPKANPTQKHQKGESVGSIQTFVNKNHKVVGWGWEISTVIWAIYLVTP